MYMWANLLATISLCVMWVSGGVPFIISVHIDTI